MRRFSSRGGQPVRDQGPHFLLCYRKEPHNKTYNLELKCRIKALYILHDIAQGFYAVIPGKLPARTVHSANVHPITFVLPFAFLGCLFCDHVYPHMHIHANMRRVNAIACVCSCANHTSRFHATR